MQKRSAAAAPAAMRPAAAVRFRVRGCRDKFAAWHAYSSGIEVISCKSSADDLGRIGFLCEPAAGESPHRWRMELAGAGSAMIDVPAAMHRPSTVSIYHNEYFETLGGLYNYNTSFRT